MASFIVIVTLNEEVQTFVAEEGKPLIFDTDHPEVVAGIKSLSIEVRRNGKYEDE